MNFFNGFGRKAEALVGLRRQFKKEKSGSTHQGRFKKRRPFNVTEYNLYMCGHHKNDIYLPDHLSFDDRRKQVKRRTSIQLEKLGEEGFGFFCFFQLATNNERRNARRAIVDSAIIMLVDHFPMELLT